MIAGVIIVGDVEIRYRESLTGPSGLYQVHLFRGDTLIETSVGAKQIVAILAHIMQIASQEQKEMAEYVFSATRGIPKEFRIFDANPPELRYFGKKQ